MDLGAYANDMEMTLNGECFGKCIPAVRPSLVASAFTADGGMV